MKKVKTAVLSVLLLALSTSVFAAAAVAGGSSMAGAMSMSKTNRMGMVFFFKKRPPDVAIGYIISPTFS